MYKKKLRDTSFFMDVTIIIINYNSTKLLEQCIKSVQNLTKKIDYEIIVIDNNSKKDHPSYLVNKFKKVNFVFNKNNLGFAAANNQASKMAKGKYLFFLNPDTQLLLNIIPKFISFMELNNDVGCIGCTLLNKDNEPTHSYEKFLNFKKDIFVRSAHTFKKILFLRKSYFNVIINTHELSVKSIDVDYITGAALFVHNEVFKRLGQFDERYFMYFEESDFQFKLSKNDFRRVIINENAILHHQGKSIKSSNHKRILYNVSKGLFIKKNYGYIRYLIFKSVYILMSVLDLFFDLFYQEYSINENLEYIKSLYSRLK